MRDGLDWQSRAAAAEKTVEVLKAKVRALYNGQETPLQREVERARVRQEKNRQQKALMAMRNAELQRYSAILEEQVRKRTEALQTIFDNVTFGFLVIDRDLVVGEGVTRSCREMLQTTELSGRNLLDLLQVRDPKVRAEFEMGIDQLHEDLLPEELTLEQLPRRFPIGDRVLNLDGRAIRSGDGGAVEGVLVTLSDITALEAAQQEAQVNRVLVSLLRQRDGFQGFVLNAKSLLAEARTALAAGDSSTVRRAVHTIKGNAGAYGLSEVAQLIHGEEDAPHLDAPALDRIEQGLRTFLDHHFMVLELSYDEPGGEMIALTAESVAELRRILDASAADAGGPFIEWGKAVLRKPARQMLGPVEDFVYGLAARLDKQLRFETAGLEIALDPERFVAILQNLTHVLRNAVDHGVEAPSLRGDKPALATLKLRIAELPRGTTITIEDDGRGIDTGELVQKAVERGLVKAEDAESMCETSRLQLVFLDGLSTAAEVSEVSGRGVGMGALHQNVYERGGYIDIQTWAGQGTRFVIFVPHDESRGDAA